MQVKPAPGAYVVTIDGKATTIHITEAGATCPYTIFGIELEMEWVWFELPGGPALMPVGGGAVQYVGFDDKGIIAVVDQQGVGKEGTYAPA